MTFTRMQIDCGAMIQGAGVDVVSKAAVASVGFASVLAGAQSFKDAGLGNLSDTYRGSILLSDGATRPAFIKDIPLRELANEVMASALAYALGLPVPRAYITLADPADLPGKFGPEVGGGRLMFATVDANTPSISQLVIGPLGDLTIAKLMPLILEMKSADELGKYFGFDAWTANVDRHIGNVLFGGKGDLWLIDHGRCFTGPTWKPSDLDAAAQYTHRMTEWLTPFLSEPERKKYARDAAIHAQDIDRLDIRSTANASFVPTLLGADDCQKLVEFLNDRVSHTPRLAAKALNINLVA